MKPKDYEPSDEVGADSDYAAWALLRKSERPLGVGDLLELPSGQLRICKYVGFEEARWLVPDLPTGEPAKPAGATDLMPPGPAAMPQPAQA